MKKTIIRLLALVAIAATLGGCVVVPYHGGHYHRHYYPVYR